MLISFENIRRKIIYQNIKKAREGLETELAYNEFEDFEISTIHIFKKERTLYDDGSPKETFRTFKWYGKCGVELLEEYTSLRKAMKGHQKWCQKERIC